MGHPGMMILLGAAFLLLLAAGAPVALALGGSVMLALGAFLQGRQLLSLPLAMAGASDSYVLLAIPFFVLAGTLLADSALARRLVAVASRLTARLPGGLGIALIATGIFLAGISGSGPADVAILGSVMIPALLREGYSRGLASGLTAFSGSIGIIVPPSIALIIYGSVAPGVSIERLFLGGVGPGICLGVLLAGAAAFLHRRRGGAAIAPAAGVNSAAALRETVCALLFPAIILGGIYFGVFTPTESAAVAVVYAVFVRALIFRDLTLPALFRALGEAVRVTAGVMILVAAAAAFSRLLSFEGVVQGAAQALSGAAAHRGILLLGVNLLVLAAGCFLDAISVFYILVPILLPALQAAGVDPIHAGVILTVNLAIGQVTPPVGVNLFVSCGLSRASMGETLRDSLPLFAAALLALFLINLIPALTLWLPRSMP